MKQVNIESFNRDFRHQLGKRYNLGTENNSIPLDATDTWDCSELVEIICLAHGIEMPDGAHNQYEFCKKEARAEATVKPGMLGFYRAPTSARVSHVIYLIEKDRVIEARGSPVNQVIYRPRSAWEKQPGFLGFLKIPFVEFVYGDGRPV